LLGVIFTGGEGPAPRIIRRVIETDAADSQKRVLIIAADSGLTAAEDAGFKPDWIIGDMDSLKDGGRLASYPPGRVIRHERDKDFTDTELAFSLAADQGCGEIWIIGGGGGRIDHLFGIRSMFERAVFPKRWITSVDDIYCIEADNAPLNAEKVEQGTKKSECDLRRCLETGANVSVFPLGEGAWEARSTGLKWPLDNVKWNRGFFGLSNIASRGVFSVKAVKGRFMIILPLNNPEDNAADNK